MQRYLIATLLFFGVMTNSWAESAKCSIEIHDINTGTQYTVEQVFQFEQGSLAQRKHFDLPGSQYSCTLAFFDQSSGTMLSCENKNDLGHSFAQSDRSSIEESSAMNNLSFRNETAFFSISSTCK